MIVIEGADFELNTAQHPGQASQSTPHNASSSITPRKDDSRKRKLESLTSDKPQKHSKPTPKLDASAVKLSWKRCHPMPETMNDGCIAVSANKVYVNKYTSNLIYEYDSDTNKWCNEIECKKIQFGMAVVNELLTIIGGYDLDKSEDMRTASSNTLLSLVDSQSPAGSKQWSEHFKPMPTKRRHPMVCCSDKHLLVAGEYSAPLNTSTRAVEIMDVETGEWKVATSLPVHGGYEHGITIIGDRIYILFAYYDINSCCSVITTTLEDLIQSTSPESRSIVRPIVWQKLPEGPPLYRPRLMTLAGNLLAIGGQPTRVYDDLNDRHVDSCNPAAYIYDTEESSWRMVCHLPNERGYPDSLFTVSSLPRDMVIVIGGDQSGSLFDLPSDIVHIGFLSQN